MPSPKFRMFQTNDLIHAISAYERETNHKPTLAVARPDFIVKGESHILITSRFGAANVLLLTHELKPNDWSESTLNPIKAKSEVKANSHKIDDIVPKYKPGKPTQGGSKCPHCQQRIADFNALGFWYGWALGIAPPYWDDLRIFVFRRDNFTCQMCNARLPTSKLNAHHIQPKEEGGTDSARNLQTLCMFCHPDLHPIYPTDEPLLALREDGAVYLLSRP